MKRRVILSMCLVLWGIYACVSANAAEYRNELPAGKYAVVVSKKTYADAEWKKVVEALVKKHQAEVIEYDDKVDGALESLKKGMPRYVCFVAKPDEAQREFVVAVSRMTRKLNDDPYTDVIWGIVTGYRAADAERVASVEKPLVASRAAAGTSIDLNLFEEGVWYNESSDDEHTMKKAGGSPEKKTGPADAAKELADLLNDYKPDLFVTSGHATFRDWQIGYPPHDHRGQFRCKDGVLYGVDTKNVWHPIHSPNPKVYLASGNCLMGRIVDDQSIALAWLGSAGVDQMIGYTVSTWYGRAGWGTRDYFFENPGRYTLSESFFFNGQTILNELITRFPDSAKVDFDEFDIETNPNVMTKLAASLHSKKRGDDAKDEMGLHWDRDTLAFYGDPAWDAKLAPRDWPYDQKLVVEGDKYTFEIRANQDHRTGKPPAMFLPYRVKDIKIESGKEFEPIVTDHFVMLAKPLDLKKGETYRLVFRAKKAE